MQPGIVSFLLQHDWLKLISEILAALGDATFFSTVQDLQSWEIPLKSCGQQISQPLPDGMLLALRTAQISDEDLRRMFLLQRLRYATGKVYHRWVDGRRRDLRAPW
jgi:hypothetical protein